MVSMFDCVIVIHFYQYEYATVSERKCQKKKQKRGDIQRRQKMSTIYRFTFSREHCLTIKYYFVRKSPGQVAQNRLGLF